MHSVDVEEVGLPSPLLAEGQFVDCVISARFSLGEKVQKSTKATAAAPIHPDLPTCKAEANDLGSGRRNQDSLHVLYASQAAL